MGAILIRPAPSGSRQDAHPAVAADVDLVAGQRRSRRDRAPVEYVPVDERAYSVEKRLEIPMLVAALLVIPVVAVEQSSVGEPWRALAGVLNWIIWTAFAVELVTMLAVVPSRWRWLRTHPLEVAIVVLTPPFLPAGLQALVSGGMPSSIWWYFGFSSARG